MTKLATKYLKYNDRKRREQLQRKLLFGKVTNGKLTVVSNSQHISYLAGQE